MIRLEIRNLKGEVERRALSKTQPLSIGKHATNDVVISEDGVAAMHCRISWKKSNFEITAAGSEGVEVNGTLVQHVAISPGDVIRIGSSDITVRENNDDDMGDWVDENEGGEEEWLDEEEDLYDDAQNDVLDRPLSRSTSEHSNGDLPETESQLDEVGKKTSLIGPLKALRKKPIRPGEQDVIRSPFVISLFAGSMILLLVSGIFWFIIGRETAQRRFDAAQENLDSGKFQQAIKDFEKFLDKYPRHKYTEPARIALGHAKISDLILGATPKWKEGYDAVDTFSKQHRDSEKFDELKPEICKYSERIAFGAAETAEKSKKRDLLAVSIGGRKLLERYSPSNGPPIETLNRIRSVFRSAEEVLLKHEKFTEAIAKIEAAIKARQPMAALKFRRRLLEEYSDLASDRQLTGLLDKTLEAEKSLITSQKLNREAIRTERPLLTPEPLELVAHARLLTSEKSDGRTVYALGKDCCFGIDTVTGDPVWRRVIGLDTPFFPMRVEASVPGFLLFDTNFKEILLVERRTGTLVWRQPLGEDISGAPLVNEGQIYVPTLKGRLYKISLETGHITTQLSFSQKLLAPPALVSGGNYLVIAGDMEVLYTLTFRPQLMCIAISGFDHKSGSIEAPLLPMGKLLLMAENDRAKSCQLRVIDAANAERRLAQIAETRVQGQVRDTPVLRGPQLFVPSSGEQISAFTVSDDVDQKAISSVASRQLQTPHSGAMYLSVGADGEFWMASSALRKFQLTAESIKLDNKELAVGLSSQPLQSIGQHLYLGRRLAASGAVVFTRTDREKMSSQWRTVVGSGIVACTTIGTDSVRCLTQAGDLFDVRAKDLQTGGFKTRADSQLKLPESLVDPLHAVALPGGRSVAYCGNPQPHLWVLNQLGLIDRDFKLEGSLEADPVFLSDALVLPLSGKLKTLVLKTGQRSVEDFVAPIQTQLNGKNQQPPSWSHLVALDRTHMIVVDSSGKLANVQFRTQPIPHLKEIVALSLEHPVHVDFVVHGGKVILADAGQRLQIINASDLQRQSQLELIAPASNALWLVGDNLYVETGRNQLHCFQVGQTLKQLWSIPLDGGTLADRPLIFENMLVLANQDGTVLSVNPSTGEVKNRIRLGQPISLGPRQLGDTIFVAAIDGSLYRIESVLTRRE